VLSQLELRYELSKLIWNQYKNPVKKILMALLFNLRSWLFDAYYKSFYDDTLNAAIQLFNEYLESHNLHYEFDYFDCDDFALLFKALVASKMNSNAAGIALGLIRKGDELLGGHAWNIILLNNKLYYFEPQTCELFDVKTATTSDGFKYELQGVIW